MNITHRKNKIEVLAHLFLINPTRQTLRFTRRKWHTQYQHENFSQAHINASVLADCPIGGGGRKRQQALTQRCVPSTRRVMEMTQACPTPAPECLSGSPAPLPASALIYYPHCVPAKLRTPTLGHLPRRTLCAHRSTAPPVPGRSGNHAPA